SSGDPVSGTGQPTVITLLLENNAVTTAATGSTQFPVPVAPPTGVITLSNSPLSALNGSFKLTAGVDPSSGAPAGIATVVVPVNTASNSYPVTVAYGGDSNYNSLAATTENIPIVNFNGSELSSTTTAAVSGAITPNTTLIVKGTVTGQSGHPAPTGFVELYSSAYNLTSANLVPGSGDSSTFQFALDSQNILQGSNQVTIQYYGDSIYLPSAFALTSNISNPLSDFSMVAQNDLVSVTAGSGTAGTAAIGLASINGFSGPVNLSCTAAAGVSCSVSPSSASLTAGGNATATLSITAPSGAANATYN